MILSKNKIEELVQSEALCIRPLLSQGQINQVSIDLRLGTDFFVSIQGRDPFINASLNNPNQGNPEVFYQETRRKIGETFILYPNQTVLASSLEYIKIPDNIMGVISIRSTYARMGISYSSIVQPGYVGCISLELNNNNKNPINLTVGACIFQMRLSQLSEEQNYFGKKRKFLCQVRPVIPSISNEDELKILNKIWQSDNKREDE